MQALPAAAGSGKTLAGRTELSGYTPNMTNREVVMTRWASIGVCVILFCAASAQAQDYCQQLLNNVARLERDAVGQPRSQAQYMLQAAQNYRNAYNQNCTGSRAGASGSSGISGGGGAGRAAAMGQVLSGLMGMAAIMEQSRQRQENEARERMLQMELERLEREEAENRQKAASQWGTTGDKSEDDKRRAAIPNPFLDDKGRIPESTNPFADGTTGLSARPAEAKPEERHPFNTNPPPRPTTAAARTDPFVTQLPAGISAECARSSNPGICDLAEKANAANQRTGGGSDRNIVIGERGSSIPALQARMPAEAQIRVEMCGPDVCIYRTTPPFRQALYDACSEAGGQLMSVAGVSDQEKACRLRP